MKTVFTARRMGLLLRLAAFIIAGYFVIKQNKKTKKRLENEDENNTLEE